MDAPQPVREMQPIESIEERGSNTMKSLKTLLFVFISIAVAMAATAAEDKKADEPTVSAASPKVAAARPVYQPPKLGKPAKTVGGGSRGTRDKVPSVFVVAPEHVGLTTASSPSLFWYVDRVPESKVQVEFTLNDENGVKPLVQKIVATPKRAGIHRIRLSDFGVKLAPGAEYEWSVALILDPKERSKDIVATTWIESVKPSAELSSRLKADGATASVYAEEGIWYDALGALSDQIESDPSNTALAEQRADLLRQVGLTSIAQGAVN
jgi:hypothetical protein